MSRKLITAIVLCIALLVPMGLVRADASAGSSGSATVTVTNSAPTVDSYIIRNSTWATVTSLVPNAEYYFNVTVTDADGKEDIQNTTVYFRNSGYDEANNPSRTYEVAYNEAQNQAYQVKPSSGSYLQSVTNSTSGATQITYCFKLYLNHTAQDSDGAYGWNYIVRVIDDTGATVTTASQQIKMGALVEISYTGNAGGTNFTWSGGAETNNSATFNTIVTANDAYSLNMSYTGWFRGPANQTWGVPKQEPTFWVRVAGGAVFGVVNASANPGNNTTWYMSTVGGYQHSLIHYLNLDFPPGLERGLTYDGTKIWINAYND
ncbi:MAG: hypothetical protein AB1665_07590 [Candidatus Thermoplasmatota archaeon]